MKCAANQWREIKRTEKDRQTWMNEKEQKQDKRKTMTKEKPGNHAENEAETRQCRFLKVGQVPVLEGGGVGCRETAEAGWLIDCSDLRAPSRLYVSLLMDFTFFVSLKHKSVLSAVLNKSICGILNSGKSQWDTPLAKASLSKSVVYWHCDGLGRVIPK